MNILPTCIPNCTCSSENMVSKKQNEHCCLWNIFVPSNILNTNLFNTGIYCWFSISVAQVLDIHQAVCASDSRKQRQPTYSLWAQKGSLEEFTLVFLLTSFATKESLCHKRAYQATKVQILWVGCLIGHVTRFRKSISETKFQFIHLTFLKCAIASDTVEDQALL